MRSPLPKVLHMLAGQTLIETVLQNVLAIGPQQTLVVGSTELFGNEAWAAIRSNFPQARLQEVVQDQPLGTGHAVQIATPFLDARAEKILIVHADTPLVQPESLRLLLAQDADLVVAATTLHDPATSSFGRLLLQDGRLVGIVEAKDASPEQRLLPLANAAIYSITKSCLESCVFKIRNDNTQKEYYFTDIITEAVQQSFRVTYTPIPEEEATGVNTPEDLAAAPVQTVLRRKMQAKGVLFDSPETTILSMDTVIGKGTRVAPFTVFERGVSVGEHVHIHPFCVLSECHIGNNSSVGPFAHIKQGSVLAENVTVGNFVEVKKSTLGAGTKAKHLSYLGDASVGERVNVGAGTVFCNYDGFQKHTTIVKDGASIGANSSLVAPLTVGTEAYIGAGSVITNDVQDHALSLTRSPQVQKEGWVLRRKAKRP